MKNIFSHKYNEIISLENLFFAWQEFIRGKKGKQDVQKFSLDLMDNIVSLHQGLANRSYKHGGYESFFVSDPKPRHIHKASVRDRLVHHAVYRMLYPFFDRTFVADSYSCRLDKGTHRAINSFRRMAWRVSRNHTKTCWVLKCDIKKFFASINHRILLDVLKDRIADDDIIWLLNNIITSFKSEPNKMVGLPLGNLTSQLFANVYMNELDQWVKHCLKAKYYIRYADDFIFLSDNRCELERFLFLVKLFTRERLGLSLHQNKIIIKTVASGVDFLGWVDFPYCRVLRATTRRRMLKRAKINLSEDVLTSYLGLLKHGNAHKLANKLLVVDVLSKY